MCESIAASCTLEPSKASVSIPCTRSSRSTPHPNISSPKVPSQRGKAPGGFTSSPRVPIGIGHVICPDEPLRHPRHQDTIVSISPRRDYSRACVHHPRWSTRRRSVGRRSLSLPREGAWIAKLTFSTSQPPAKVLAVGSARAPRAGTINCPTARALAASSRSGLNVTPRPAPRPRHGQPATANTSPRPPLHEVRRDNTEGAASRKSHHELESHDAPTANRHKTNRPRPPPRSRAGAGLISLRDHAGQQGSATHKSHIRDKISGSRRPEARHRDSEGDVDDSSTRQTNRGDTVSPRGD
jgi:hypothetical protein